jgi:tRNA dimethylallyltransferase
MAARLPILLAGPTGVGKSAIALELAERIGGEIISVDSMQVYRGMDLGTSKPTPAERARVRHHLVDVADLRQGFDAARFVNLARAAALEIIARGAIPIFCGGTGLYFRAYLEGIGTAPPGDPNLRRDLEGLPLPELLNELELRDPATFKTIDKQNPRRVIRALEVIRLSGRPFSQQRARWRKPQNANHAAEGEPAAPFFGLERSRADLRKRIEERVDRMFAQGLVEETKTLLGQGLAENQTALQALGYRQVVEFLKGMRSLADTIELAKQKTRQYAKRQMTWFRHQATLEWIPIREEQPNATIVRVVEARLE